MKIGYVGVGNWAAQLKEAFERRGHEAAWHVRSATSPAPGFGPRLDDLDWKSAWDSIDLVVCAAPPNVVHSWACMFPRIPMLVTKPFDESRLSRPRTAPTYVDLWRVLTPEWGEFNANSRGNRLTVAFGGRGPKRSYVSGSMDYGPHAVAYLLDFDAQDASGKTSWEVNDKGYDSARVGNRSVALFGNSLTPNTHLVWEMSCLITMEFPSKSAGLAKLVEHCETGNTYTYELNKRVMHELRNVPWTVK